MAKRKLVRRVKMIDNEANNSLRQRALWVNDTIYKFIFIATGVHCPRTHRSRDRCGGGISLMPPRETGHKNLRFFRFVETRWWLTALIACSDWTIWIVLFSKGPVYTITKYQQNPNCYAHGVNRNEPIENM